MIPCHPNDDDDDDDDVDDDDVDDDNDDYDDDDDDFDDYGDDDDHPPGWRRPNCTLTMRSAISGNSGLSWFVITKIKPSSYICIC